MTIAILYRKPGQTIARPFSRACNVDEALELIAHFKSDWTTKALNERKFLTNMDTEEPVAVYDDAFGRTEFFAFIE